MHFGQHVMADNRGLKNWKLKDIFGIFRIIKLSKNI